MRSLLSEGEHLGAYHLTALRLKRLVPKKFDITSNQCLLHLRRHNQSSEFWLQMLLYDLIASLARDHSLALFLVNIYLFCSFYLFWVVLHNTTSEFSSSITFTFFPLLVITKLLLAARSFFATTTFTLFNIRQSMSEMREEPPVRRPTPPWLQRNNFQRGSLPLNYPKQNEMLSGDQLR